MANGMTTMETMVMNLTGCERQIANTVVNSILDEDYKQNHPQHVYPERILKVLRQRAGLDETDVSIGSELQSYSPTEAFSNVLEWEGICGYDHKVLSWICDIWGVCLY